MKRYSLNIPFETLYAWGNKVNIQLVPIGETGMEWLCEQYWNEYYVPAVSFMADMEREIVIVEYEV